MKGKRVVHLRNTKIPLSKERLAVLGGSLSGEFFLDLFGRPVGCWKKVLLRCASDWGSFSQLFLMFFFNLEFFLCIFET